MSIIELANNLAAMIESLDGVEDRIYALNSVRLILHNVSPMKHHPVDCVLWEPSNTVEGNAYNPNHVAKPEMKLLEKSIIADGYTQPIVGMQRDGIIEVVDGFHRSKVGVGCKVVKESTHGYLPVVRIRSSQDCVKDRMAATIRHNRARGVHGVMPMADIVANLIKDGLDDTTISKELGMSMDEVLRLKQILGIPSLFKNHTFSKSWE
jgi:ParB-like chromosome segregation protein Spo0J